MKNFKKLFSGALVFSAITGTALNTYALSIANGELQYDGGQTSSIVYSHIFDAKPTNDNYYKVKATVKVGSNTTSSGWVDDDGYAEAYRSFWSNESSYYDYYLR